MDEKSLAVHLEHLHCECLEGVAPELTMVQASQQRFIPPGDWTNLMDFIAGRVTVGDVRAWMIQAGAKLPGTLKPAAQKKEVSARHGKGVKDAFIVTTLAGKPFMPGLFAQYKDAVEAAAIADMPTKIDRYSIPLDPAGDYCEKCVEVVVKAYLNRPELLSYHE